MIRLDGQRRDVLGRGAVLRKELLKERLVRLGGDLLVIALRADVALVLLGRCHLMLEPVAKGRGSHRNGLVHAGRRPLPIERDVIAADQRRHDEVRFGRLDLGDGGTEVAHLERKVVRL